MAPQSSPLKRSDAARDRLVAAALGLSLGIVWVVGLAVQATPWLTWMMALAALGSFGTVALVPERRSGFIAATNLAFVAAGLAACWIVAKATGSTPWLAWCCFGAALLMFVSAVRVALLAAFDRA